MKLELKHLAPYLPYKLKVADSIMMKPKVMNTGQGSSSNWVGIKTVINYRDNNRFFYKPILRPLYELDIDNETNTPSYIQGCTYSYVNYLLSEHYDIFGLIERGLAIDINTLNQ